MLFLLTIFILVSNSSDKFTTKKKLQLVKCYVCDLLAECVNASENVDGMICASQSSLLYICREWMYHEVIKRCYLVIALLYTYDMLVTGVVIRISNVEVVDK